MSTLKKTFFALTLLFATQQFVQAQTTEQAFSPSIKVKALIHSRFEASLTDSIDVAGKYFANPVTTNFRMRRIELRTDIKLNDKFSGVVRVQLPELKGSSVGKVIELAYMDYKYNDMLNVRFGQFKSPFELDEQTSHEDLRMIDRGPTSVMFVNNSLASYQPGAMVFGTFMKSKTPLSYYLAFVNGSNRAVNNDDNSQKNIVGRLEFVPIKGVKIGANAQQIYTKDTSGLSYGGDLSIIRDLNDKMKLIVEGEYITGYQVNDFNADTTGLEIGDYTMGGYFGQVLLRSELNKSWCKTFEVGGKYEHTDPNTTVDDNAFNTITGGIGFIFTPDNMARLQLNIVHTDYEKTITPGGLMAANMFVTQFQLKF
ncbi:MAG TPA: porin [Chitinophagales bacterium]|nr:OprO/OprP family phosphate-selective porin [Chitinophagales bacterium]HMU68907.1 porin [Chitinophagales bacterium]HMX04636.1 porin [Chitinophagales bacterium]HMZ88360.1 porin [Chitinophagales bacterium]HNA58272.1 porin [Chitinophagales bacterium]